MHACICYVCLFSTQTAYFNAEADADELAELRRLQPGNDGGVKTRRFQRRTYPEQHEQHWLLMMTEMLEFFIIKTTSGSTTENCVEQFLEQKKHSFERLGLHDLAEAVPTSYKGMLTALQDSGICCWDEEVYYDQCPCGTLYRNSTRGDFSKLQACHDCDRSR